MTRQDLFLALDEGATLLTATRRLAREVRRQYDAGKAQGGLGAWPSADILTYPEWVHRCYQDAVDESALGPTRGAGHAPVPLSAHQSLLVWQAIVAASPRTRDLLSPAGPARHAREAWTLLQRWRLPPLSPGTAHTLESRAFCEWAAAYRTRCAENGWTDDAALPERVAECLRGGTLDAPQRVLLAGFDDTPPQQANLLDALRSCGSRVEVVAAPQHAGRFVRVALPEAESEAWAAARWARYWLEAEPHCRIGIVAPDLPAARPLLERVLDDVLAPGAVLPGGRAARRLYNIASGFRLADYPIVSAALALLSLTPARQSLESIGALLHTPFVAGAETEFSARGLLDMHLRARGAATVSLATLQAAASEAGPGDGNGRHAPLLAASLAQWRRVMDRSPERQPPSAWAATFSDLLSALGWPGERPLASDEYQTLEKWRTLLDTFAGLDLVAPRQPRGEALSCLAQIANDELFQPEGPDAPVQVLGMLDAGGLEFDHIWLLGLHDEVWPPPPRPNPLLPRALQARHGMPHASMERELEISRRETARLLTAAPEGVVSHPALDADRVLRPSPLILHLPPIAPDRLPATDVAGFRSIIADRGELEMRPDFAGPPLAQGALAAGGTGIFRDQSACPFRAFARHRLHAQVPDSPQAGLDAAQRGTLVHRALEQAWQRIGDHGTLCGFSAQALWAVLEEAVQAALSQWVQRHPERLGARFLALEHARLVALLRDWMAHEMRRVPFRVVGREQERTLQMGGLTVSGRIDRIDRLEDGRHIIIDYKTGEASLGQWLSQRPEEPQLPLYAAAGGFALAGVAFARVRRKGGGYLGVAEEEGLFPDAKQPGELARTDGVAPYASLEALVEDWRGVLERLAADYRGGTAHVDPKKGRDTCAWCDLPALCRIAELRPAAWAAPEEADD